MHGMAMDDGLLSVSAASRQLRKADLRQIADRSRRLLAVTTALTNAATVAEVANVALGIGLSVVEAARGFIGFQHQSGLKIVHSVGYEPSLLARLNALRPDDDGPSIRCIKTGQSIYLRTAEEFRTTFPWAYEQVGVVSSSQAYAAMPLFHNGNAFGALSLSFKQPTAFGAADRTFTRLLADATAGALARAINFDADHESRREADLLARAREDVLSIVAHDLRNALNLISGTAQLLVDSALPEPKRQQLLGVSVRASNQMNRLIGDLLDANRIQAGTLAMELEDCTLASIVEQVEENMRPLADKAGISFQCGCAAPDTRMRVDPARMVQALGNLVSNALKFTPRGGDVAVTATRGRKTVAFTVVDDGPGISEAQRRHLFEKFWQAERDRRGVGLGLTIVQGIAQAHGGRVIVRSQPGRGCTFALVCPLAGPGERAF